MAGGCKCRPISAKRSLTIEANVVVSERTDYAGCLTLKTPHK